MANVPNKETIDQAMSAAKAYLSAADAAKLEKLAKNPEAIRNLTSGLSDRDWAHVLRVMNDPHLLKRVMTSSRGKEGLRGILDQIPE